ncbi:MAG: CoA-binding protein [Candidatus Jordarchaeaceae archaeon]
MEKLEKLNPLFYPKAVAVFGATDTPFKYGNLYMQAIIHRGYPKEHLYPINPNEKQAFGIKAYPRVQDVPEPIDLAIFTIPKKLVKQSLRDCVEAKVKFVSMFTSGFSESTSEREEGKKLEEELLEIIAQSNTRIVGPNGMGVYSFDGKISYPFMYHPPEDGPVSFISQSGGLTVELASMADFWCDIRFNKIVSFGNAINLESTDYLEYFAEDPKIKVINMYIEGVKNGPRFFKALKEAVKIKPVIVWKGGRTEAGSRATLSHTGSLAGSNKIWEVALKQAGAVQVYSMEELCDVTMAFLRIPPPKGLNTAILGAGGGRSVVSTDELESAGLIAPSFSPEIKEELSKIVPDVGTGISNPIDCSYFVYYDLDMYTKLIQLMDRDPKIDIILLQHEVMWGDRNEHLFKVIKEAREQTEKSFVVVLLPSAGPRKYTPELEAERLKILKQYLNEGILIYTSMHRASNAIYKMVKYYKFLELQEKPEEEVFAYSKLHKK